MSVEAMTYRQVVGNFATGVAVVTAGRSENRHAVTVNSFTSVSLEPTLLLVCLTTVSHTRAEIMATKVFNINLLSDQQEHISRFFAQPQDDSSWFEAFNCREGELGAPIIPDCLAHIECHLVESHETGDHTVMIGEVHHAYVAEEDQPLLFFRGKYGKLGELAS